MALDPAVRKQLESPPAAGAGGRGGGGRLRAVFEDNEFMKQVLGAK